MARKKAPAETPPALQEPTVTLDLRAAIAAADQWRVDAEHLLAYVRSIPITTPELEQWAADTDGAIAAQDKAADADKTAKLGPIRQLLNLATSWWTGPAKLRAEARAVLKNGIAASRAAREAHAAALALRDATSVAEVQAAVAAVVPVPEGMHERITYTARVVDTSKVPIEFWRIDQAALDEFAARTQTAPPGCELVATRNMYRNPTR